MTIGLRVGDQVPGGESAAVSREMLSRYAHAGNDPNPLHIDSEFARAAGHPDVFAHGMFVMAMCARWLRGALSSAQLDELSYRFDAITRLADRLHYAGRIASCSEGAHRVELRIEILVTDQDGHRKGHGHAIMGLLPVQWMANLEASSLSTKR